MKSFYESDAVTNIRRRIDRLSRLAGLSLNEVRDFIDQEALALWPDNNQENTQP